MRPDARRILETIQEEVHFIIGVTLEMTFETFVNDPIRRRAVERSFEIVGEAMNRLVRRHPNLASQISAPQQIVGLRNVLIHGYDVIDYQTVWSTIRESLLDLRNEVDELMADLDQ